MIRYRSEVALNKLTLKTMKKLKGLLTGLALGGLVGMLFAPKKGSDLRSSIKQDIDGGNYGLNAFKNAFTGMGKDMGDFAGEVSKHEDVKEYLTKGKRAAQDVQDRAVLWLEANYGITEDDLRKAKKEVDKKTKKAKSVAKKTVGKAKKAATKASKAVKKAKKK
jgi:gas vesicle protein